MSQYRSPVLDLPGAVDAPEGDPDHGVPLHHGDPLGEQRAAEIGPVVVDRSHRDVLSLTGPERLTWLEGFVSQHVAELTDGQGAETLILDANGRVEQHAMLAEKAGRTLLDTEPGRGADLLAFLTRMVFWAQVAPEAADLAVLTLAGRLEGAALRAPDGSPLPLPTGPYQVVEAAGAVLRRTPWPGAGTVDVLVPRADLLGWFTALTGSGARAAGTWALEALRVADTDNPSALRARPGRDTDERTIPHEVPAWIGDVAATGAVHLDKGCYRGQETVARVHNLGRSPRVLVRLHLDGSTDALPVPGDPVTLAGRPVGRVGTVVHHHEQGPVALALVKRTVDADAELWAGEGEAAVAARVDPDTRPAEATPQAGREAVRRLRGS